MNLLKCSNLSLLLLLFFFISLFTPHTSFSATSRKLPTVEEVIILSGREGFIPTNTSKIVEFDEKINLYALLKSKDTYYLGYEDSLFPDEVKINDKTYSLKEGSLDRWKENLWGKLNITWYKVMPRMAPLSPRGAYEQYSNVFSEEEGEYGAWRGWQIIEYEQMSLKDKGWSMRAEKEAGTVRFRAELTLNGKLISSRGKPDSTHPSGLSPEDYDRGIKDTVHRISRLSNHPNKLIRYIEALNKVPWLWGAEYKDAVRKTPSSHQSDFHNPVGIECSSILISALRAMGNEELEYTTAENLARGKYTIRLSDATLTLTKRSFFKDFIPRGISWSKQGRFYIHAAQKIEVRDGNLNLVKEFKNDLFQFIDMAISEEEKIYAIVEKDFQSKIVVLENSSLIELFTPEVEKTIYMEDEVYLFKMKINPGGIYVKDFETGNVKEKKIYLLESDTIYLFSIEGEKLKAISLEGAYSDWTPAGYLSVEGELFYIPTHDRKILTFNEKGEIVNTINLEEEILNIDVREGKIAVLHPFPMRVELYNLDGSFFRDFTDRFLNEKGEEVVIHIGSSLKELQFGDLMITTHPTSHLLLFYEDNANNLLDSKDKVICAGHQGIEIRKVSYFEGRKFLLRRLNPDMF
ncbi:hypothetical protein IBX65_05385 [Candidatus Aerophobetes bacterium]|nr:hypothetical protein [Candidatus Aerophobetes bacterium]